MGLRIQFYCVGISDKRFFPSSKLYYDSLDFEAKKTVPKHNFLRNIFFCAQKESWKLYLVVPSVTPLGCQREWLWILLAACTLSLVFSIHGPSQRKPETKPLPVARSYISSLIFYLGSGRRRTCTHSQNNCGFSCVSHKIFPVVDCWANKRSLSLISFKSPGSAILLVSVPGNSFGASLKSGVAGICRLQA